MTSTTVTFHSSPTQSITYKPSNGISNFAQYAGKETEN